MKLDPIINSLLETDLYKFSMGQAIYHQYASYKTKWSFKCRNEGVKFSAKMVQEIKDQIKHYKAAYFAGCAFTRSYVGYVHAVAHSLGGCYNVPHGLANAVLLPFVLEAYGKSAEKKLAKLAYHIHLVSEITPQEDAAKAFIQMIKDMKQKLNIGDTIEGIKEEDIKKLSKYADKEANPLYPVPKLMNAKELQQFFYKVMEK